MVLDRYEARTTILRKICFWGVYPIRGKVKYSHLKHQAFFHLLFFFNLRFPGAHLFSARLCHEFQKMAEEEE